MPPFSNQNLNIQEDLKAKLFRQKKKKNGKRELVYSNCNHFLPENYQLQVYAVLHEALEA